MICAMRSFSTFIVWAFAHVDNISYSPICRLIYYRLRIIGRRIVATTILCIRIKQNAWLRTRLFCDFLSRFESQSIPTSYFPTVKN